MYAIIIIMIINILFHFQEHTGIDMSRLQLILTLRAALLTCLTWALISLSKKWVK